MNLADRLPIYERLGHGGHIAFDRVSPLVCVHDSSQPAASADQSFNAIAAAVPNHVIAHGSLALAEAKPYLVALLETSRRAFGTCALVELTRTESPEASKLQVRPRIALLACGDASAFEQAFAAFKSALEDGSLHGVRLIVEAGAPSTTSHHLDAYELPGIARAVLEVDPVFYNLHDETLRGLLLRDLCEVLEPALARFALALLSEKVRRRLPSSRALGRKHLSSTIKSIDANLARVAKRFNLLLQLTPINGEAAFERFRASGCEEVPDFEYRTVHVDPDRLKREIHEQRIEDVCDPSIARLLREQRDHIDQQLSMLTHYNRPNCLYASLQMYGNAEDKLYRVARGVLETLAPGSSQESEATLDAAGFSKLVEQELNHYRRQDPSFSARVEVRGDVSSLTVANGTLLVPERTALCERRAHALLAHEVGTHLLTYHNGNCQPLALMSTGLAGYEQLQEGLAVISEYLAGGLTPARLRLLAARVVAVRHLLNKADFVQVFREMHRTFGLPARHAFFVTMRVFRGGGFTKDAIYLRGVLDVLELLQQGRSFETLCLGKFAASQIELIQELRWRGVLRPPALLPRVLRTRPARQRLELLQEGPLSVFDLCQREAA
jgi:uncharacterized protein (TIGR02421 family)